MTDIAANRYLTGLYAPVAEQTTAVDLEVTGTLPPELDGRYLRNGPNPVGERNPATYHWFVGEGMVHGVRLRDGRAEWYRSRWIRGTSVAAALGVEVAPGSRGEGPEVANTNVIGVGGRTFAIVEAGGHPAELTDELETICFSDFDGTLPNGYTAHPKRDPRTGLLHAVSYYWIRPDVLEYTVLGPDARIQHVVDLPVGGNPMVHDCSITETTLAVYDLPVTFSLDAAMEGAELPYRWDPERPARVGLMPLGGTGDDLVWFGVDPCYVFHPVNAWDDGDRFVADVIRHPKMFDHDHQGPNEGPPVLWRWTFDRATGRTTETQLDDRPIEFPRVDERLVGRRHRYSWATGLGMDGGDIAWPGTGMVRYDAETGGSTVVGFGPGRAAGELVFVPRADDAAEDDGWYLTYVYDAATDRSELVVLDASAPDQEPVARVHLPARIPLGFHGNWVPTGS